MRAPIKLSVIETGGKYWTFQMLYVYHGVLFAERFIVGMN